MKTVVCYWDEKNTNYFKRTAQIQSESLFLAKFNYENETGLAVAARMLKVMVSITV